MKRTILLADDSPTIQRLVTQTFADSDFSVVSVSNGDAAIRKLDEIRADIVLADVYMPGRNGYEVCAHVRSKASLAGVPVILLAGAFDAYDEQTAANAGATTHIRKPFEPRALVSLVMSVSGGAQDTSAAEFQPAAIPDAATPAAPTVAPVETAAEMPPAAPAAVVAPVAPASQPSPATMFSDQPAPASTAADAEDLLGLEQLFQPPETTPAPAVLSEEDIDRIAERVMRKITKEAIENVAWDVVPEIAEQVLRDELNRKP